MKNRGAMGRGGSVQSPKNIAHFCSNMRRWKSFKKSAIYLPKLGVVHFEWAKDRLVAQYKMFAQFIPKSPIFSRNSRKNSSLSLWNFCGFSSIQIQPSIRIRSEKVMKRTENYQLRIIIMFASTKMSLAGLQVLWRIFSPRSKCQRMCM